MCADISIKELINGGGSQTVEFINRPENVVIGKTICAFLNGIGGTLLVGVSDSKQTLGVPNAEAEKEAVRAYLSTSILPEAPIDVRVVSHSRKNILLIKVWGGSRKPYVFSGTIFYRRNTTTQQATTQELSNLLHDRQLSDLEWERIPSPNLQISELNKKAVQEVITESKENGRGKNFKSSQVEDFLAYYNLLQNSGLTNAAVVAFAKEPTKYLPQVRVRVAALHEGKTSAGFRSDKFFELNLIDGVEAINQHLRDLLKLDRKFNTATWTRTNGFQYPMEAISEGIMNALVHREFSDTNGTVTILILPDRLEISNPGKLPPQLSAKDLKKSHDSYPQNPDIAHICFLRGYIDKLGTGTLKILDGCKQAGLQEPKWTTERDIVKLTFFNNLKLAVRSEGVNAGVTKGVNKKLIKKIEGVIAGITEGVTEGVKERLVQIVATLTTEEGINASQIGLSLNVPIKSLERYIKLLKSKKVIAFKGSPKTGGYYLERKVKQQIKL